MLKVKQLLEKAYTNLRRTPWEEPEPPVELVELLRARVIAPCRALDVGCGTGNYSLYLAEQGFELTGVDLSHRAITIAKQKAKEVDLRIAFQELDALKVSEI